MPKYGTDYTKSAIDLKNPLEVRDLLLAYGKAKAETDAAQDKLDTVMAEMVEYQDMVEATKIADKAHADVKTGIEKCGSLQDIPAGFYALKQRRTSVTYSSSRVRELIPDYAKAILVEEVDARKFNSLVKGGLVSEAEAKAIEITTPLAPAYIIGLAPVPAVEVADAG